MQKQLGASMKLRKKEICEGGCGFLELTCSSIGMNRHTDIKKSYFTNNHGKL